MSLLQRSTSTLVDGSGFSYDGDKKPATQYLMLLVNGSGFACAM